MTWQKRFAPKVDKNGPVARDELGPCWIWTGARNSDGYGQLNVGGKMVGAHILAFREAHGPVPCGIEVCHACDIRACVRVSHLFAGTHRDNMQDAARKGRCGPQVSPETRPRGDNHYMRRRPELRLYGDRNPSRLHPECLRRGESAPWSRLTEDDVRNIRLLSIDGVPQRVIAHRYAIAQQVVSEIVRRKIWRHVA